MKIQRIKELVELCNRYSDAYYNGKELVSDVEFDMLYSELVKLETETNFVLSNSPSQKVGHEANGELPKTTHDIPMLSLDKITTIEEIEKLIENRQAIMSLKEDGLSVRVHYDKNGNFKMAATRGDGRVASDITSNIACFINLPLHIKSNGQEVIVDGEAICTLSNFKRLNDELDEPYKHPRAVASGSVLLQDHKEAKKRQLQFIAWKFVQGTNEPSYGERLKKLQDMGFTVVPWQYVDRAYIKEQISMLQESAKVLSHPYDGIVVALDDTTIWDELGSTSKFPRHSKAYKFAQDAEETIVTHFEFSVGKTGQITPVACFNPIILDNTEVSKASCHNVSYCNNLNLGVGARVKVIKAMQIIPQITECVEYGEVFEPISHCPICGVETMIVKDNESEVLMCPNDSCSGKLLGKLTYAVSKKALDVNGLSEATLKVLIDKGWLKSIVDIYHLSEYRVEWIKMDGFGKTSVEKILKAIEESRNVALDRFLCSLSIPNVGSSAAKTISERFGGDYHEFSARCEDFDFTELDDFGQTMNDNIHNYLNNHIDEMRELAKEMNFIVEETVAANSALTGLKFCITGSFSQSRDALKKQLEDRGAKFVSSVSKNLDVLFVGDKAGSKLTKAQQLGIMVADEDELMKMLN